MRRKLVAGNWKMHGRLEVNRALVAGIRDQEASFGEVGVWLAPPSLYLGQVAGLIGGSGLALAAQNVASEQDGAFTGEISAAMLRDVGCQAVLVGHSERRSHYGEGDAVVAAKFLRAVEAGLVPVLCIGEALTEREAGQTEAVVLQQLSAVLDAAGERFVGAVVAYEPVWAIGTGRVASPEQAQQVHRILRAAVMQRFPTAAAELKIIYGGSVKAANAAALFAMPDIDGALVGGASLDADEFAAIVRCAGQRSCR